MRNSQLFLVVFGLFFLSGFSGLARERFAPVAGDRETLRVSDPVLCAELLNEGAGLVEDYGAFQLVELNRRGLQALKGDVRVKHKTNRHRIKLHAGDIDTSVSAEQRGRAYRTDSRGKRLQLVQFAGPIKPEWRAELEASGCRIVSYVPHNAYLVYGDSKAHTRVSRMALSHRALQWRGDYLARDKVHPKARKPVAEEKRGAAEPPSFFALQLVDDPQANAETLALLEQLKTGPIRKQSRVMHFLHVVVPLEQDALDAVAEQPDVVSIWPYAPRRLFDERQNQIVAGNLTGSLPSGPGYLSWLAAKGFTQSQFTASGFVVDIADSGIDDGTTQPNHFGLYVDGDTNAASRVAYNRLEGSANSGSTLQGCDGHGTINAHIIGGYNDLSGFPHEDSSGYQYGLGVCPFVKVGSSVIFDPSTFTSPDYADMLSRAYADNARISSDSWGADTFGGYDIDAMEYDALVRDAQPDGAAVTNAGNQEMVIVFAAGNSGPFTGSVGSPGTAKNVITVGAAENVHSHATTNLGNNAAGNDGCATPDSEADSADDIASFSSRGPCSDGRSKPEIVAPGTHITGGVAQDSPPPDPLASTGNDLACFDAEGVCALEGSGGTGNADNFFPSGQQFYSTSSGTSHSTPAVAGAAALLRQYWINEAMGVPSPAMTKAYLVAAARYMAGTGANDDLWSNSQGMGSVNLGTAFDGAARILRDQEAADTFTGSGQLRVFTGIVDDLGKPFRVTVSWTDAPGSTSGDSFNNDIDLEVTVGGQTYLGNNFSGATSVTGGSADPRNNTESVFLPAGVSGAFVVKVTAANINSDGVPNEGTATDQDFALVIYNGLEEDAAVVEPGTATVSAEDCGIGNGFIDPNETVTLSIPLRNVGTVDTTNLTATLQNSNGVSMAGAAQSYGALVAGGSEVTNAFTFTATGACGSALSAILHLEDGAADLGSVRFDYVLGDTLTFASALTNDTPMALPGTDTSGPADLYPSTIEVSGLRTNLDSLTVSLYGLAHTYPDDLDVLLVAPSGEKVILMSAAGGGNSVVGINLTLDDEAASGLPDDGTLLSGTYRPSDFLGGGQVFDAPAPSGPYGFTLAEFDGINPNGTWSLYIVDAAELDSGALAGGWSLQLTTGEPLCCQTNQPPILEVPPQQTVVVSNSVSFDVTARDPSDGDAITLSALNVPAWASFDTVTNAVAVTNEFSGTPIAVETSVVSFVASDKDGAVTQKVTIVASESAGPGLGCGVVISEIAEGTSNNKGLEIYNGMDTALNMAAEQYQLDIYYNGNTGAGSSIVLIDTIQPGDTYVLINSGANDPALVIPSDADSSLLTFNGNDAVVLRSGGSGGPVVDCVGQIGNSDDYGGEVTLVRDASVTQGDTNPTNVFSVAPEWNVYPQNTFTNIGLHTMNCAPGGGSPPILIAIGPRVVVISNELEFAVTAVPTDGDTVTLGVSNAPGSSVLASTNENGVFTWSVPEPLGVYTAVFYAADDDGADVEAVEIVVREQGVGGASLWMNEIHYDNGTIPDANEGVEVAGPAGTDLSAYELAAYNGANGLVYSNVPLTGIIDDEGCGYGAVWVPILGLQNGNPDGVALVVNGTGLVQFLSWEGTFVAGNGPANGVESEDIGQSEGSTTPPGDALQLSGSGSSYADFVWTAPSQHSRGDLNALQSIVPCTGGDQDGDGIPDDVETAWSGTATGVVADADQDGDGLLGLDEYILDYDPINTTNEQFILRDLSAGSVNVTFGETTTNRVYSVDATSNLLDGASWQVMAPSVPGSNGVTTVTDPSTQPTREYRVRVHLP